MKSTPDDSLRLQESSLLNSPNYPQDYYIHASNLTTNFSNIVRSSPLCLSGAATERLNELDLNLELESPLLDERKTSLSRKLALNSSPQESECSGITIRKINSSEHSELIQMHVIREKKEEIIKINYSFFLSMGVKNLNKGEYF